MIVADGPDDDDGWGVRPPMSFAGKALTGASCSRRKIFSVRFRGQEERDDVGAGKDEERERGLAEP